MFVNSYLEAPIDPDTRIDRITAALNNRDEPIPQPIDLIGRLDPRWLLRKDKSGRLPVPRP